VLTDKLMLREFIEISMKIPATLLFLSLVLHAQTRYDLLLKGGHVIDPKNGIDRVMDVGITGGRIARVSESLDRKQAKQVVDASGLYITPGLVDIHAHVYVWKEAGGEGVQADDFSFRSGVTTMVDAGSSGWRTFPDFRDRIIAHSRTRILAFLNIVGAGMGTGKEDDPAEMDAEAAARTAKENPGIIVGFKSAHYAGPAWESVDGALKAGELTGLPVMIDFGRINKVRNLNTLLLDKLRPGDIYTHCFSGHREELLENGKLNPAMEAGRRRKIIFDIGHGAGSFYWYVAVPAYQQGFRPDSISTDLHINSMNSGMKDMTNLMSKMLNLGSPLAEVIAMSTWNPAREIHQTQLGNLDPGAEADIAVLRLEQGNFGLVDSAGARKAANQLIVCEMTLKSGKVMWDLNGRASEDWTKFPYQKKSWLH
jgi:dihydroorotase